MTMNDKEIHEVQQMVDSTSSGPWIAEGIGSEGYTLRVNVGGDAKTIYDTIGFYGHIADIRGGHNWQELRANAEFIAWCRDGVPKLLNEIKRLKQELQCQ